MSITISVVHLTLWEHAWWVTDTVSKHMGDASRIATLFFSGAVVLSIEFVSVTISIVMSAFWTVAQWITGTVS